MNNLYSAVANVNDFCPLCWTYKMPGVPHVCNHGLVYSPSVPTMTLPNIPVPEVAAEEQKITSDGGSTAYYDFPEGCVTLNDLIEHKDMSFALGNIFKACYRFGEKDVASKLYDVNKIIYFAERIKKQLEAKASLSLEKA